MARDEAHAGNAACPRCIENFREARFSVQVAPIGVHVLPEQGHFLDALCSQGEQLGFYGSKIAAHLAPSHVGHDAVGAEVVAPRHDGHPRMPGVLALHGKVARKAIVFLESLDNRRRRVESADDEFDEVAEVVRSEDDIDMRHLLEELLDALSGLGGEEEDRRVGHVGEVAADILAQLRAGKDAGELADMIAAQRIAEKALDEVLGILRPGLTEQEVASELVYRMYKYGGEANSFDPIVVTGSKTSLPHGVPGDKVIAEGDFVTMDFGTMYNGYCSDMTRTVAVGHATQEMKDIYSIVLEAQLAGIAAAKPGVPGRDIDGAARKVISDAGYGQYFGHGFGHSLGLEIHEAPNANPANDKPMPEGAAISAEPGIYIPGKFGVRIEDVMWLHDGGSEVITKAPKQLIVL